MRCRFCHNELTIEHHDGFGMCVTCNTCGFRGPGSNYSKFLDNPETAAKLRYGNLEKNTQTYQSEEIRSDIHLQEARTELAKLPEKTPTKKNFARFMDLARFNEAYVRLREFINDARLLNSRINDLLLELFVYEDRLWPKEDKELR